MLIWIGVLLMVMAAFSVALFFTRNRDGGSFQPAEELVETPAPNNILRLARHQGGTRQVKVVGSRNGHAKIQDLASGVYFKRSPQTIARLRC